MEFTGELSRRELLVLKEIRLTGRTNDRTMALRLLNDDMIADPSKHIFAVDPKRPQNVSEGFPVPLGRRLTFGFR